VLSSFLSYDPLVSIKGLKSPAFFFAFYFVSNVVDNLRTARLLGLLVIGSCLVNVAYSAGQIVVGRGLKVDSVVEGSPFQRAGLTVGDVILEADGQKVRSLEDLSRIADSQRGRIQVKYQRGETIVEASVSRRGIRRSELTGVDRLGITTSPGRNFRISGLYSHYETYAEVLQLIIALAAGFAIAHRSSTVARFLLVSIALLTAALMMTYTRAPMAGLAVGVAVMVVASSLRRAMAFALVSMLVLVPAAMFAIERARGPILFDPQEGSTAYRLEVWREALALVRDHPLTGIGKGSEAKLRDELGLYDGGNLPPGHFHSTPIQIATWWGLPALILYCCFMAILAIETWRLARVARSRQQPDAWGIALGGLGAIVAFNVSSLAHFNFGDGEVVMMFWLITGLVFAVRRVLLDQSVEVGQQRQPAPPTADSSCRSRLPEPEVVAESSARAARVIQR
jgi:hypothetical protein